MEIRNKYFQTEEKLKFIKEVSIERSKLYDSINPLLKPLLEKYGFVYTNHEFERENKDFRLYMHFSLGRIDKTLNEWSVGPFVAIGHKKANEIFKRITNWTVKKYGSEPYFLLLSFAEVYGIVTNDYESKYSEKIIINKTQDYSESFNIFPEFCSKFVDFLFSKDLNYWADFLLEELKNNNVACAKYIDRDPTTYFYLLIVLHLLNSDKLLDNIEIFKNKYKDRFLFESDGITCSKVIELLMEERKNTT